MNDKSNNKNLVNDSQFSTEINLIKDTLNNVSEAPNNAPSLDQIRKLVRAEVAKKETKQRKSLFMFSIFSLTALSLMFTLIVNQPMMFIKIQLASLIAIPFAVFKFSKKVGSQ